MQKQISFPLFQQPTTFARPVENLNTQTVQQLTEQTPPVQRLIVLIPDANVDEEQLGGKLWSIASETGVNILLLSRVNDIYHEARTRLRLDAIAAITRDKDIQVETCLSTTGSWEPLIRSVWQADDLVVCQSEEYESFLGLKRQPLASALASSLKVPVYALTGFYPNLAPDKPNLSKQIFTSLPLVTILLGFFVLLASIQQIGVIWLQALFLCFSVIVVYGLILAWENFVITRLS